eukprot:1260002-Prymnesium_polylepis.1
MGHRPSCVPVVSMNFRISAGAMSRVVGSQSNEKRYVINRAPRRTWDFSDGAVRGGKEHVPLNTG